jgi:hypothetical protein
MSESPTRCQAGRRRVEWRRGWDSVPDAARAAPNRKTTRSGKRSEAKFGGESGIRTLLDSLDSVSYRFHNPGIAMNVRAAVAPCTLLHAGTTHRPVRRGVADASPAGALLRPHFGDFTSPPRRCGEIARDSDRRRNGECGRTALGRDVHFCRG